MNNSGKSSEELNNDGGSETGNDNLNDTSSSNQVKNGPDNSDPQALISTSEELSSSSDESYCPPSSDGSAYVDDVEGRVDKEKRFFSQNEVLLSERESKTLGKAIIESRRTAEAAGLSVEKISTKQLMERYRPGSADLQTNNRQGSWSFHHHNESDQADDEVDEQVVEEELVGDQDGSFDEMFGTAGSKLEEASEGGQLQETIESTVKVLSEDKNESQVVEASTELFSTAQANVNRMRQRLSARTLFGTDDDETESEEKKNKMWRRVRHRDEVESDDDDVDEKEKKKKRVVIDLSTDELILQDVMRRSVFEK